MIFREESWIGTEPILRFGGVTGILQENPEIQVILDLHRDGVKEGTRLISQVNGKETAKIMFFHGMSRTPEGELPIFPTLTEGKSGFAFPDAVCG